MLTRMYKRILTLAAVIALALPVQALAERVTVYTATDNAKVYDADGTVVGTLPANTELTLTGMKDKVCRVERDGKTAYMLKADLSKSRTGETAGSAVAATPTPAPTATPAPAKTVTAYVGGEGVKVYDGDGETIATLSLNDAVTVTAVKGSVCRISANGKTGYVRKGDLSASPVSAAAAPTPTPAPTATPAPAKTATAYANGEGVKVYSASGEAIATLSLNDSVTVTAVKGSVCKVSGGGRTGYMKVSDLSCEKTAVVTPKPTATPAPSGGSTLTPAKGTAKEMDWWNSDIQTIFARGVVAQITDVETGLSWRERRNGGTNHADCQPLTVADTAVMKKVYGGTWSWNRRAVFVTIDGVNYAASINGMPHGSGSITDNNFNGHHCIHFTNSRTHGSNKVDPQHQAAIKKAASTTL